MYLIDMPPLALQLRPKTFDDIIGQPHLTDPESVFRKCIEADNFSSFVLYGPSGTGKTSIVHVLEQRFKIHKFNATTFTAKEVRKVLDGDENIIVMIDECYRLTAPQSDILLPYLETSRVRFIGCTVENPFHSMRSSLLSRCHIFETEPLSQLDVLKVLIKGVNYLKEHWPVHLEKDAAKYISVVANGDARKALSILEMAFNYKNNITIEIAKRVAPSKYFILADQDHFDLASAFQGSIQASDPDSAIFWLAKWLESGEDPRYIARRLMVSASEDAAGTPICAAVAHAAYIAAKEVGRPECDIPLAHATILVATAPRNKSAACAIWSAVSDVRHGVTIEVPKALKDSHYKSCEKLGHGSYNDGMNQEAYVSVGRRYYKPEEWGVV
jgi:putative ATPase